MCSLARPSCQRIKIPARNAMRTVDGVTTLIALANSDV